MTVSSVSGLFGKILLQDKMHLYLLRVFLVAFLVMPRLGSALEEESTRKGKRTEVEQDTGRLKGGEEEGEADDDSVLTISDDKNDVTEMKSQLESEKKRENEKRETRKGKRTRVVQDTNAEGDEAIGDRLTRSEDKNERSGISNPREVEEKKNEKRATRKGKRTREEQDTDTEGDEAIGDRLTRSEDKNNQPEVSNPRDVEEKKNEKRATRKGKRTTI